MTSATGSERLRLIVAIAVVAMIAGCARDEYGDSDTLTAGGEVAITPGDSAVPFASMDVPDSDAGAVEMLLTIDAGQVDAAELGQDKARNAEVKSFAREMARSHGRDRDVVKQLARRHDIPDHDSATVGRSLVVALDSAHKQMLDRLGDLSGDAFDRAFMSAMVTGHEHALDLIQRTEVNIRNEQLRQHFSELALTVREHLDRAVEIQRTLGSAASDTAR